MTTLPDRPNTCLLVIDVQNGVVADAYQRDALPRALEQREAGALADRDAGPLGIVRTAGLLR